jgi:hypothetical protein
VRLTSLGQTSGCDSLVVTGPLDREYDARGALELEEAGA